MTLDETVFLFFNSHHTPFGDVFLSICSSPFPWVPFYVACAVFLAVRFGWTKALFAIAMIGIAAGLSDFICAKIIRPEFQFMRPSNPDNPFSQYVTVVNNHRGGAYGFPSCHAANCFAFAVGMLPYIRRNAIRALILLWAVFICYTRMYLGLHYPSDLLVGALVGSSISMACYFLGYKIGEHVKLYRESRSNNVIHVSMSWNNNRHGFTASLSPSIIYVSTLLITLLVIGLIAL